MLYCILANLQMETPAKRDTVDNDVKVRIGGKKVCGQTIISKGQDGKGYPTSNIEIRFENRADMEDLFAFIKDRMIRTPVLRGTVSKHDCPHDIGGTSCVISEEYNK